MSEAEKPEDSKAPENAKPLGADRWPDEHGNAMDLEQARKILPGVHCECGWGGVLCELLMDEEETTLYCPECRTTKWAYKQRKK